MPSASGLEGRLVLDEERLEHHALVLGQLELAHEDRNVAALEVGLKRFADILHAAAHAAAAAAHHAAHAAATEAAATAALGAIAALTTLALTASGRLVLGEDHRFAGDERRRCDDGGLEADSTEGTEAMHVDSVGMTRLT